MRTFSRWMSPLPEPRILPMWVIAAVVAGGLVLAWILDPVVAGIAAVVVVIGLASTARNRRHLKRLTCRRPGDALCTFVRDESVRGADPWVLRAVFEGLNDQLGGEPFPLRGSDTLLGTLRIDDEDLVLDTIPVIAARAQRVLPAHNDPRWAKLRTVADLVAMLSEQPRVGGGAGAS